MNSPCAVRVLSIASIVVCFSVVGCGDAPTVPDPAVAGPRAAKLAEAGGMGGKWSPGYVTHPLRVTLADRAGDAYVSDGGGPYTDEVDGTWVITDYADPSRPDHFQFISGPGSDRLTRLTVPDAVPPTDCEYFRFSVRDVNTPDLWAVGEGWTGSGSGTLQCGQGRGGYRVEIGECVAVTRGAGGVWAVVAEVCPAEVWSGDGRKAELLGTFPVAFAFDAIEL